MIYRNKYKFQDPIRQNAGHVRAIQEPLDLLPATSVKLAVIFNGEAESQTEQPAAVYDIESFLAFMATQTEELLSLNRVQFYVGRIETARQVIMERTDLEHVEYLRRKHGIRDG